MAQLPTIIRNGLEYLGLVSPNAAGSPEQEGQPPELDRIISSSPEMRLNGAYFSLLQANPDEILSREGGTGLLLYDRLLDDDVAQSCLQQRRLAITSRDWEVTPGDDKDPRSVKAAEEFRAMLQEVGFDRVTGGLHFAVWYGYAVAEGLYTTREFDGRPIIWLKDIVIPNRAWFGFTMTGELRFASLYGFGGEEVPPNKFMTVRTGGTHDFAFYGLGLGHWAYWPVWFKRAMTRFWALYLEKLANPTVIAPFTAEMTEPEKNQLLQTLVAIGTDSAAILPDAIVEKVERRGDLVFP
jgi:phage gp29-like protein